MVLDGKEILEKHYVYSDALNPIGEEQIQPNGVDLRVKSIYEVTGRAALPENSKMDYTNLRKREAPYKEGWYSLNPTTQYTVDFYESVSVPAGYCGIIYPRSSLLRAGSFITSALWDTGFQGSLGASIRTLNPLDVQINSRLAQIVFHQAAFNGHRYDGRYQGTNSQASFIT